MALEGTLTDMPLADMLEVFHTHHRSGRLLLSRQEERGLIFFGEGRMIDALLVTDIEGNNVTHAEDAILRLLEWREADFSFEHDPSVTERPRRVIHDIDWFLAASRKSNPPPLNLSTRLQPAKPTAASNGPFTLNAEEWRLVGALWPQRTLGMVCVELDLSPQSVISLADAMLRRGLLTIAEDVEAPRAPAPRPAADTARPMMAVAPLKHIARTLPQTPQEPVVQSHLLKAIIRRVRTL